MGLVELLKSKITGRVWDDSNNYDGLQAATTDGEGKRVLDEAAEPGIPNEEMRLTQWLYVKPDKWVAFAKNHSALVEAMLNDAALNAEIDGAFERDADGNKVTDKTVNGENVHSDYGFISKGVWVRNIEFGEDRYTAKTEVIDGVTVHLPYMTGSRYLGNGVVAVDTAAGTLTDGVLKGAGVYTFDTLPTVTVVQNDSYDEFYLAAYRVEIPYMENTGALNSTDELTNAVADTWLLTRSRTYGEGDTDAETVTPVEDIMYDSDVVNLSDANKGVAGGYIVAQQQGTAADAGKYTQTRQLNGQIILSQKLGKGETGNSNTTEDVDNSNNMADVTDKYDWMKEAAETEEVGFRGGDVGEVRPPYTSIAGYVWLDKNNNGMRDSFEGADEPAPEPRCSCRWSATGTMPPLASGYGTPTGPMSTPPTTATSTVPTTPLPPRLPALPATRCSPAWARTGSTTTRPPITTGASIFWVTPTP